MKLAALIIVLIFFNAHAQGKATKTPNATSTEINYASAPWNTSASEIDTAFLFLQDPKSGKVAKVLLEETAPDSAVFNGQFSVDWAQQSGIQPNVYIPSEKLRSEPQLKTFYNQLKKGELKKRPVVVKRNEDGTQLFDVYDTKEQVLRAQKVYEKQRQLEQRIQQTVKQQQSSPLPKEAVLEPKEAAEKSEELTELALESTQREVERLKQEQLERQRAQERLRKQEALAKQEREKQLKTARDYAETALDFYRLENYAQAKTFFEKSVQLDPKNTSYYFQYGVTLYRLGAYDDAIVKLKIAEDTPENILEKSYYLGLSYLRLKELAPALEEFKEVKAGGDPRLSPSAAFYMGVIHFNEKNYDASQKEFQHVLDHSRDPKLDNKAEEYIDRIVRIMDYERRRGKRFHLSGTIGAMYDSNILFSPDNESLQGSEVDDGRGGTRGMLSGSAQYNAVNGKTHTFKPQISTLYMYSADDTFNRADPWLNTLQFPYSYKTKAWSKGYEFTVSPGYETLFMDPNDTGTRETILNSIILDTQHTFVMDKNWLSSYTLDMRQDDSLLDSSVGDENRDALKIELGTSQSFFLNNKKSKALITGLSITQNSAEGDEQKYQRYKLKTSYLQPLGPGKVSLGASLYQLTFPDASDDRKDTNISVFGNYSKKELPWWSWGAYVSYANNTSNVDEHKYSRYVVLLTSTFNYSF